MFLHSELGKPGFSANRKLKSLIDDRKITLGGNCNLKIYGTLSCKSGRRMMVKNRVFFQNEEEAVEKGYRPCGHCMKERYLEWKKTT